MSNSPVEQGAAAQSNTKAFIVLVVLTLAFVGVVGGAFYGGTVVGKNQAEDSAAADAPALPEGAAAAFAQFRQQAQSGQGNQSAERLRQQFRSQFGQGGAGQAAAGTAQGGGTGAAASARAAAAGGGAAGGAGTGGAAGSTDTAAGSGAGAAGGGAAAGAGFGGGGPGGFAAAAGFGGGVFGRLTSVEGSELKVQTPGGVITVKLSEDTVLRTISEVSADDLETGVRITVAGTEDDSGTMEATSITILPAGAGFGGGQGFGGGGQGFGGGRRGQGGGGQ